MASEHSWRFEFELDSRPPSVNHLYRQARNGRRYLSAEGKAFKEATQLLVLQELRKQTRVPDAHDLFAIDVRLVVPRRKLYLFDADNCWKALLDSVCAALGIDDRYMMRQTMTKEVGEAEKTVVAIWQIIPTEETKPKPHTAKARRRKKK